MQVHSPPNENTAKDLNGRFRLIGRMVATHGSHSTSWPRMISSLVHNVLKTMVCLMQMVENHSKGLQIIASSLRGKSDNARRNRRNMPLSFKFGVQILENWKDARRLQDKLGHTLWTDAETAK